jgi:phage terminase large subunit-like protein
LTDDGVNMIPMRQGFISMNAPTKEFERRLLAQEINHGGNAVLRWMADKTDPAGNMKPDKQTSSDRIDGIVASILSLAALDLAPSEPEYQVFFAG